MNHTDHVNLLRDGMEDTPEPGVWADLGSGAGAFTLALAELLGPADRIYSVDQNAASLREQHHAIRHRFPHANVHYLEGNFTRLLPLPLLNGIVMANSLHFVTHAKKPGVLELAKAYLKPGGHFILVEYNVDHGNIWVPHPLSYASWERMARQCGFSATRCLSRVPSRFLGEIYSALSVRQ